MKINRLSCIFLLLLFSLLCTEVSGSAPASGTAAEAPGLSPGVLVPEAPGTVQIGYAPLILDISHASQGYLTARGEAGSEGYCLQITGPDGVTYSCFPDSGTDCVLPFTAGNGDYRITAYEKIDGSRYGALYMETVSVELENEFLPFLYPNQYVSFAADSACSQFAIELAAGAENDLEALDLVYSFVVENFSYDYDKAETVRQGYLPDVDAVLESRKGICFDYAAVMTCMLRSLGIPCKLDIGYSLDVRHAWVEVYLQNGGQIAEEFSVNGGAWNRMDPTFASCSSDAAILDYIGDGDNYTIQYSY